MLSEQQQRIMGYFIEEAKDHLNTIEQGLLNLQGTIEDPEMVNEVFRAAHSVKGGAAMLGLTSIQHTSHRLEDYFKILKECPIKIDHALETLFLRVYDTLQELLEHLQGPFGLTDEKAAEAMAGVEPVFQELNRIFGSLVAQSGGALPEDVELPFVTSAIPSTHSAHRTTQQPATVSAEESAVQLLFQSDVPARLREMLQVFKQEDNANSRQQLQGICTILAQYGEPLDLIQWRQLVLDAQRAIASPNNTYRTLAPVIIKEIKQAQELVISGNPTQISASENLKALLPAPVEPAATFDTNADFLDLFGTIDEADSSAELSFADFDNLTLNAEPATPASATAAASPMPATELPLPQTDSGAGDDDWFSNALSTAAAPQEISPLEQPSAPSASSAVPFAASLEAQSVPSTTLPSLNFMDSLDDSEVSDRRSGPEVGIAELNSLADLFEGDMPDLGLTWQEENVISDINEVSLSASGSPELDTFSDLLLDSEHSEDLLLDSSDEDLSGLLDNSGLQQGRSASTSQPFENEFLDGLEPFDINSDGISGELSQSASESFLDLDALPDLEAPSAGPEGMGSSSDDFFLDTPGLGDDANASDLGGLDDLFGESAETEMGAIADPFASELDGLGDIFAEDTGVVEVAAIDPSSEAIQEADAFSDSFLGLSVEPSSAEPDLLQSNDFWEQGADSNESGLTEASDIPTELWLNPSEEEPSLVTEDFGLDLSSASEDALFTESLSAEDVAEPFELGGDSESSELDLNLGDFSFDRVDASAGSGFGEEDGSVSLLDVDSSADPFASASPEADSDFANFLGGGLESPDEVSAEELFNPFETEGAIATPIESSMADLLEGVENPSDTSDSEGLDLDFFGADASAVENSASGSTAEDVGVDPFTEMTSGGSLDEDAGFGLFGDAEPNLESSSDAAVLDLFADEAPPDGEAEFDLFTETATTADEEAGLEFAETPGTSTNAELDLFAETEPEVTEDAGLDLFAEPEVTADTELDLFAETESGTTEEAGLGLFSETEPETNEDSGFDPFADAESASNAEVGSELFANSELESGDDAGFDLFADTEPASAAETGLDLFANTESAATEEAGLELFAESESRSTESASNDDGFDLFTQTESASEAFDGDAGFDLFAEEAIAPPPSTPEPLAETVSDTDLELDLFAETEPALPMSGAEESFADDFAMELPAAEAEGLMFDTNETLGVGEFPELATDPALSAAADPLGLGEVADSEPIGLDELGIPGLEEIGSDSSSFDLETAPESVLMPLSEDASEQLEDWIEAAEVSAEEVPAESDDPFGFDAESENPLDLMAMSEAELTPLSEEASEQLEDWIEAEGSPELDDPFGFDAAEGIGVETEAAIALDNFNFADSDLMAEGDSDLLGLDAAIAPSHSLEEVTAPLTESSPKAQLPVVEQTLELDGFSGFSDLEAMLTEASASGEAALEMPSDSAFSGLDDFADLESMLGEESPAPVSAAPQSSGLAETGGDFDDLEALLGDAPPIPAAAPAPPPVRPANDEFGDLEDMLKDADQTLGGGAVSGNRKAAAAPNRRSNRRGAMTDQTMRVSVKHLDNLNNLVGEMVVNRNSLEQAQERLRQFLDNLLYQVQQLSDVGQRMRDLYERSLLESSLLSTRRSYHLTPNSGFGSSNSANNSSSNGSSNSNANGQSEESQGNHATGASFDALEMDRFTGFHTLSQEMIELIVRVRESASDIDFVVEESDQVTRNFRQITTQLQEGLTKARMVPFAQTADRLPRGVRDNALKYGKQAELVVEGRDTLIDKMIVEQLYDPMTHLVNNAIAHGIETPAERIAAGKPPLGQIVMRTFHQGNQTIISVSDDGAGIDPERVKSKAIDKGLITAAEAKEMSRMDTYDLLFHHGFSTADQIDDLKGRGVGLDVVRSNLTEIRGVISIDSAIAKGTTFTIRLPLTLSISKALCCISNRARIAFPMDGVEDMLDVPKERVQTNAQGQPCIQWRDALLPFQPLSELLRHGRMLGRGSVYGGNQEEDIISVVVLRSAGKVLALQVDQVLGEQEIVIKQLEGPVPKPVGIAGATVLGDGRIMPIADVLELIDLSEGRVRREVGNSLWVEDQLPPEPPDAKTEPTVLIVDDSITVRELLSMTFNKVGYRVEQARDGQEAWEKLRSGLPCDLVFCDIEMPRMDGLELLSRIQKDSALNHLPIAMLTSRGADRHRQMAIQLGAKGYFTKPYLEEALLDAAQRMLKGEVLVASSSNA